MENYLGVSIINLLDLIFSYSNQIGFLLVVIYLLKSDSLRSSLLALFKLFLYKDSRNEEVFKKSEVNILKERITELEKVFLIMFCQIIRN